MSYYMINQLSFISCRLMYFEFAMELIVLLYILV